MSVSHQPGLRKKLRVLIVDDSAVMRKVLREIIAADADMEVVAEAFDGREGVELAQILKPDVITMDIEMPRLNGFEAIETIMTTNPRPIVVISSIALEGSECIRRSKELGAVDALAKPASGNADDLRQMREEVSNKLKRAATTPVSRIVTSHELKSH